MARHMRTTTASRCRPRPNARVGGIFARIPSRSDSLPSMTEFIAGRPLTPMYTGDEQKSPALVCRTRGPAHGLVGGRLIRTSHWAIGGVNPVEATAGLAAVIGQSLFCDSVIERLLSALRGVPPRITRPTPRYSRSAHTTLK